MADGQIFWNYVLQGCYVNPLNRDSLNQNNTESMVRRIDDLSNDILPKIFKALSRFKSFFIDNLTYPSGAIS